MPEQQPVGSATCLAPEVLAAFADRTLAPDERAQVEAHLAAWRDCYELLTDDGRPVSYALLAAAVELEEAARTSPSPDNLHASGTAQLLLGRYDEAIEILGKASAAEPSNARLLSDLAAAFLARGRSTARADDLSRALALTERALKSDPECLEALFNRALALESLELTDQAREAWLDYASRDRSSWAEEAKRRAERPQVSRSNPLSGLIPWADAPAGIRRGIADVILGAANSPRVTGIQGSLGIEPKTRAAQGDGHVTRFDAPDWYGSRSDQSGHDEGYGAA